MQNQQRLLRVTSLDVVDSTLDDLALDTGSGQVLLVTCYPFNALNAGGPLRYVVTLAPELESAAPAYSF